MILLIDAGNSSVNIGTYDGHETKLEARVETSRLISGQIVIESVLQGIFQDKNSDSPAGCSLSSVVPKINGFLRDSVKRLYNLDVIEVNPGINTGLIFQIKNPETLGSDRIANAVAAFRLYKSDCIVIDFGTATTCCLVTARGEYRGGAIMPGLSLSAHCLSHQTAKLPDVRLRNINQILGEDTENNILAGILLGQAGGLERLISEMKKESGLDPKIIATGGFSTLMEEYIKSDFVNPLLTLEGLKFIYEMNISD